MSNSFQFGPVSTDWHRTTVNSQNLYSKINWNCSVKWVPSVQRGARIWSNINKPECKDKLANLFWL